VKGLFKFATQKNEVTAKGIVIGSIVRVQRGGLTNRFLLAKGQMHESDKEDFNEDSNCLSIIYRAPSGAEAKGGPHKFETLDLVISSDTDFNLFVRALSDLMALHDEERKQYDPDFLFLRFHWMDIGKALTEELSSSEWLTLCNRMNVPVKKAFLTAHYEEFLGDMQSETGLTLYETANLLDEVKEIALAMTDLAAEDDPAFKIWKKVLDSDPVPAVKMDDAELEMEVNENEESISAVAFLSFVRSDQKEYKTSLEEVHDRLFILNGQITANTEEKSDKDNDRMDESTSERISRSRFIAYITSDSNDIMNPEMGEQGYEEMTHPLSHYWINTSHDTYLAKLSDGFGAPKNRENIVNARATDVQMYTSALLRGVRALELDTWDGVFEYEGPVVARRQPVSSNELPLLFSDVLRAVRSFLLSYPDSLPIILCIENHCSLENQDIMADYLEDILGESGMLYIPPENVAISGSLPSPESMRGKVVIKCKRPKAFVKGATVMNDDFDAYLDASDYDTLLEDQLDDEDEEEKVGVVVAFEATGPVRSTADDAVKKSPEALLEAATAAADESRMEVERARARAEELRIDADDAEEVAAELGRLAGLSPSDIRARASEDVEDDGTAVDLSKFENSLSSESEEMERSRSQDASKPEEGLEVQDFFEGSVEGAKSEFLTADAALLEATDVVATKAIRLQEAEEGLEKAHRDLASSYAREKELEEASRRAASEARSNREHADTARQRVETVRDMLRNWKDNANSAETVVHTAMTEAKISDQRAAETEARAERALATAEKDRTRADIETQKEEDLEHEVAILHEKSVLASSEARSARERMEKAATMLDKVNEQIKLIENSTQYQKEISEGDRGSVADDASESSPLYVSKFSAKHAAKLHKREELTKGLIAATKEKSDAETHRRSAHELFEEKARMWKVQAEVSARARKQADRSLAIYEELAEHAEEEREAAALRKVAHEKAAKNVTQSDSYRSSVQAQLMEAERASTEAANLAVESRKRAERLAKEAADAKDHSIAFSALEARKMRHQEALRAYEEAVELKKKAETRANEARRLLETSSEVLSSAKREVAAEIHRANAEKQAERSAISAYNKAVLSRKQATHAQSLATLAETTWDEKKAALAQAKKYKEKYDKVAPVSLTLASMTLLDSHKLKNWEKSLAIPCTQMHSFPQGLVLHMLDTGTQVNGMLKFTHDHMLRSFPSWNVTESTTHLNCNPVAQWAVGCQMVAMNFQVSDEHLLVNDGRFRMNGSSGYVLKPEYLMSDDPPSERGQHWKLQILSGRYLPKPSGRRGLSVGMLSSGHVNPFVRVYLYDGITGKTSAKLLYTTHSVDRNGLNPVWDSEKEFEVEVERPSIAVLLFSVWDKRTDGSSDFIAGAAVPVCCMREGYRSVSLYDSLHTKIGPFSFASLFVRAQKI
jgi:hypothetical protein